MLGSPAGAQQLAPQQGRKRGRGRLYRALAAKIHRAHVFVVSAMVLVAS